MSFRCPAWLKVVLRAALVAVGVFVLLFEEIVWVQLSRLMARLAAWRPVAAVEAAIGRLPPYLAMLLFVLPWAVVLPLKLAGLWLMASGKVKLGATLFSGSEVVGVAILARLYALCRPALSRLAWFVRLEGIVLGWRRWAHDHLNRLPPWRRLRAAVHLLLARLRWLLSHRWFRFRPAP